MQYIIRAKLMLTCKTFETKLDESIKIQESAGQ